MMGIRVPGGYSNQTPFVSVLLRTFSCEDKQQASEPYPPGFRIIGHAPQLRLCLLLVVALHQIGRNSGQVAEETFGLMVRSRSEIEFTGRGSRRVRVCGADIAWTNGPNSVDRKRLAGGISQHSFEMPGGEIVSRNVAARFRVSSTRKLGYQKVMAKAAEIERCQGDSPRRI